MVKFGPTEELHEFDAVSADESIVAEVKHVTGGQAAQLNSISRDLVRLNSLENKTRKLMFITDPLAYWLFVESIDSYLWNSDQGELRS